MADPTFLVIGGQKCGTTWLSQVIRAHPDVFAPSTRKEVHFFDAPDRYANGIEWYRRFFDGHQGETAVGEFTPEYLWVPRSETEIAGMRKQMGVPGLVRQHYPDMKFIVTLRDPVKRAVSAYYHHIHVGLVSPKERIRQVWDRWGILSMGYYHHHLTAWFKQFPREQFLILIYEEDIMRNRIQTLRVVYRFLGVDETFMPDNLDRVYNPRRGHLFLRLEHTLPSWLASIIGRVTPFIKRIDIPRIPVHAEEIEELNQLYHESNQALEQLLGRKLPWTGL